MPIRNERNHVIKTQKEIGTSAATQTERMENIIEPAMTPTLAQVADGTDDQENSMPNVFRGDDDDDEDAEEDAKILNMSLIKSILGNSNYGSMLDLGNSNQGNMSDAERAEKPHESRKVSFRDVGSVASSHEDEEKTHDELVKKIGELQAKLTQAEIDKSAEKAMRRKKDKSLVKLAKELNKRAADQQAKEKQVNLVCCILVSWFMFFTMQTHAPFQFCYSSRAWLLIWKPNSRPLDLKWMNGLHLARKRQKSTMINLTKPIRSTEMSWPTMILPSRS